MKMLAMWVAVAIALIVLFGALRSIIERQPPFLRPLGEETKSAYALLTLVACLSFAWSRLDLNHFHVVSIEIPGFTAKVDDLQQKVKTLSDQMEVFFGSKRIEVFNRKNWDQVRRVGKTSEGVILEVTLEHEPIRGSIEVFDGPLLMPEGQYRIDGRNIQFPADTDTPADGLTIKYYPRLPHAEPR
jgi:hypothetical protein